MTFDFLKSKRFQKYAMTFSLCYSWICLGLYSEILGLSIPTLMYQTKSNYEEISVGLAIRSIGLLIGSLVGGWLSDRNTSRRPLHMALSLVLASATMLAIPWCGTLIALSITLNISGFSHGALTTNGNPLLAAVWQESASGPFSLMHSGYGIGASLAPLIMKPYTYYVENATLSEQAHYEKNNNSSSTQPLIHIGTPYGIVAGILCSSVVQFLLLACIQTKHFVVMNKVFNEIPPNDTIVHENKKNSTKYEAFVNKLKYKLFHVQFIIILCTFIIYFAIVGNERVFGKFIFTYAMYGAPHLDTNDGYLAHLIYWVSFCLSRIILFVIALCVDPKLLLFLLACGTLISSCGFIFLSYNKLAFFINSCLFGLFKSPLFPVTLAAINCSTVISGLLVIVVNFGSAAGATLLQYTAGRLIHLHGQIVFPYLVSCTAVVVLLTAIVLVLRLRHMGSRFRKLNVEKSQHNAADESTDL